MPRGKYFLFVIGVSILKKTRIIESNIILFSIILWMLCFYIFPCDALQSKYLHYFITLQKLAHTCVCVYMCVCRCVRVCVCVCECVCVLCFVNYSIPNFFKNHYFVWATIPKNFEKHSPFFSKIHVLVFEDLDTCRATIFVYASKFLSIHHANRVFKHSV